MRSTINRAARLHMSIVATVAADYFNEFFVKPVTRKAVIYAWRKYAYICYGAWYYFKNISKLRAITQLRGFPLSPLSQYHSFCVFKILPFFKYGMY